MLVIIGALPVACAIGIFGMMGGPPIAEAFVQAREGKDRMAKAGGDAMGVSGFVHETLEEVETDFFTGADGHIKILVTPSENAYLQTVRLADLKEENTLRFLADVWEAQAIRRAA